MGRFDKLTELAREPLSPIVPLTVNTSPKTNITALPNSNPVPPVRDVRPVLPVLPNEAPRKRVMKQRHPFDIYQDQYETLQQLALEERRQGGVGSMSAIVREAIDKAIAERRR